MDDRAGAKTIIGNTGAVDILWLLLLVGLVGGLWFVAYKIEPHWASKDGTRFMCTSQSIWGDHSVGKNKETHVAVTDDGLLLVQEKRLFKRERAYWQLVGKSDSPPKGKQVYVAVPRDSSRDPHGLTQMTIYIPNKSRAIPVLEELLEERARLIRGASTSGPVEQADPPDPG